MKQWRILVILTMCSSVLSLTYLVHAHQVSEEVLDQYILNEVHPDETTSFEPAEEGNRRSEGRTYFSFPEWYIVYSAQEYADFLQKGGHPSDFPNIDAMEQFWQSVNGVKKATAEKYSINDETETVINTIGYSFTFEYVISAFYESTIGRLTKLLNLSRKSPEDIYNEQVAYDYGKFLHQIPWYEFPYFQKLKGLWTEVWGLNSLWVRGIERRIILSISYTAKGSYAAIIKLITRSSFNAAEYDTEFIIKNITTKELEMTPGITVVEELVNGSIRATSTRYRAFTHAALLLLNNGVEFESIENNDSILVSTVAPLESKTCIEKAGHIVFRMPILTNEPNNRFLLITKVRNLGSFMNNIKKCGTNIEHLYDF